MTKVEFRVLKYDVNANTFPYDWNTSPTEVKEIIDVRLLFSKGFEGRDSAKITLRDIAGIRYNDYVEIYLLKSGEHWESLTQAEKDSRRIFTGIVTQKGRSSGSSTDAYEVALTSYIEFLFRTPINLNLENITAVDIIKEALTYYNNTNPIRIILWDQNNPTTKSDGTPFPTLDYFIAVNRPMIDVIEEASSSAYTSDGRYVYKIEPHPTDKGVYYFIWNKGEDKGKFMYNRYFSRTLEQDITDMATQVIYHLGNDLKGNPIHGSYVDLDLAAKYGLKVKYLSEFNGTIDEIIIKERLKNPTAFNPGEKSPNAYPYTFTTGEVANTFDEFNDIVIAKAKAEGKKKAQQWIFQQKVGLTETLDYPVTVSPPYNVGEVVYKDFPELGLSNIGMYVTQINITKTNMQIKLSVRDSYANLASSV